MTQIALISLFGALGVLLRFGFQSLTSNLFSEGTHYSTLLINILGSFLIGIVSEISTTGGSGLPISRELHLALSVGLLGGFTTFSTFSLENWRLMESSNWSQAMINLIASPILALIATAFGVVLIRKLS